MNGEPRLDIPADVLERQQDWLRETTRWAQRVQTELGDLVEKYEGRIHFRPSSSGVSVIGVGPEGNQLGKKRFRDLTRLRANLEDVLHARVFGRHPGRLTRERSLQSYLIGQAYCNRRFITPINKAMSESSDRCALVFVTDEVCLPTKPSGLEKFGCDLLACRQISAGEYRPVQMELKCTTTERLKVIRQLAQYAPLVEYHIDLFAELFSAVLGREIRLTGPCERWAVLPEPVRRPEMFAQHNVRLVTYPPPKNGAYEFKVAPEAGQ